MILKELFGLSNLVKTQTFFINKMTQVVIIDKNKTFIFLILKMILSSFEYFNNSQKFIIKSFIANFYKNHLV